MDRMDSTKDRIEKGNKVLPKSGKSSEHGKRLRFSYLVGFIQPGIHDKYLYSDTTIVFFSQPNFPSVFLTI